MINIYHQPKRDGAGSKYWSANIAVDGVAYQVLAHSEDHAKELVAKLGDALNDLQLDAMEYARAGAEAGVAFGRAVKP